VGIDLTGVGDVVGAEAGLVLARRLFGPGIRGDGAEHHPRGSELFGNPHQHQGGRRDESEHDPQLFGDDGWEDINVGLAVSNKVDVDRQMQPERHPNALSVKNPAPLEHASTYTSLHVKTKIAQSFLCKLGCGFTTMTATGMIKDQSRSASRTLTTTERETFVGVTGGSGSAKSGERVCQLVKRGQEEHGLRVEERREGKMMVDIRFPDICRRLGLGVSEPSNSQQR
jgi:hypothetical protein